MPRVLLLIQVLGNVNAINADEKFNNQIFQLTRQIAKGSLVPVASGRVYSLLVVPLVVTLVRLLVSVTQRALKYFNADGTGLMIQPEDPISIALPILPLRLKRSYL